MEIKQDLRITRTYKLLTDAFLQLMEEMRFEDITINVLCERAMIRRTTFYKHFADKYEFFAFIIKEIQRKFDAETAQKADTSKPQDYYVCVVQNMLGFLAEHEKLVHSVLKSSMFPILLDILSEQIASDVGQKLKNDKDNGVELPANPELMARIFAGALISVAKWWLSHKDKISKDDIIKQLAGVMLRI
jgi:AcrR family transcriptional regulator